MTVAERAREVGLLRAAGATRRQVNVLVLVQAVAPRRRRRRCSALARRHRPRGGRGGAPRPARRPRSRELTLAAGGAGAGRRPRDRRDRSRRPSSRPTGPAGSRRWRRSAVRLRPGAVRAPGCAGSSSSSWSSAWPASLLLARRRGRPRRPVRSLAVYGILLLGDRPAPLRSSPGRSGRLAGARRGAVPARRRRGSPGARSPATGAGRR